MTEDKKKELWRSLKFFFFSASAGLIQILSFTLFNEVFQWKYGLSYPLSVILSVIWNFTLNRRYTFKSASNIPKAMLLVAAFYLVFTPASTWLGNALTAKGWNEYLVTALNMVLNLVLEYFFDKYVVFRDSIDTNDLA